MSFRQLWYTPRCVLALVIAVSLATVASAELVFDFTPGNTYVNTDFDGLVGWRFTTTQDLDITRLGFYDTNINIDGTPGGVDGNGLFTSHRVAIFSQGSNTILAEATVASGTAADLVSGFRMASVVGGPYNLTAGTYDIFAQVLRVGGLSDGYIDSTSSLTAESGITIGESRFSIGSPVNGFGEAFLDFDPTGGLVVGTEAAAGQGYFGPTFEFTATAVPEPSSLCFAFVVSAVGIARIRRRCTHRRASS